MSFFSEIETEDFLLEFGSPVQWVDPTGSFRGDVDKPVYGVVDIGAVIIDDNIGARQIANTTTLTLKTSDAEFIRNNTKIFVDGTTYRIRKDIYERIDDGDLIIMGLERE